MADELGSAERRRFLDDRRWSAQGRYDYDFAPGYDAGTFAVIMPTHARFMERFLDLARPGGVILDMPCGTGKYFRTVELSGRSVVGYDQSIGMLAVGRAKFPHVPTARLPLHELSIDGAYDGVMCMDSMEFVGPEDWPAVIEALRDAGRVEAPLYLTVEIPDDEELGRYYEQAREAGYPVTPREQFDHASGGYHYFPERDSVVGWLHDAGLAVTDEAEGDDYWHLLLRRD